MAPNDLLLNVLREDLELTGTKYACGIGECSACTVEMDGLPVLACLVLAVSADGSDIVTVEGLRKPSGAAGPAAGSLPRPRRGPVRLLHARHAHDRAHPAAENPAPDEEAVRDYLKGNLCRCTGYASIVRAVMAAANSE